MHNNTKLRNKFNLFDWNFCHLQKTLFVGSIAVFYTLKD